MIADTIQIVSTSLLGLTVGCARCHNHRYDPISHVDYHRFRAIFEPALDWKKWQRPNNRRISLASKKDRELRAATEAKARAVVAKRAAAVQRHIDRTLDEELLVVADELREPLRTAYRTPKNKRSAEQSKLLGEYPSVGSITSGSLYLYSQQRGRRATAVEAEATRRETAHVARLQRLVRSGAPAVTAATLATHDPKAAAEIAAYRRAAKTLRATDTNAELKKLADEAARIRASIPKETFVRALTEPANHTPVTYLFRRGNHDRPGDAIEAGELAVLEQHAAVKIPQNDPRRQTTGRRLAYARHLTSGSHPLPARVFVNRVWHHHFGRGLVESLGDFGKLGERPTHPKLLDWLASQFVDSGWQIKRLHRQMLTSRAYRQASERTAQLDEIDPENHLFARMNLRRVESEVFRDATLAATGTLNERLFGPPVPVKEDAVGKIVIGKENLDGERKPSAEIALGGQENRRSLYVQVRRSRPLSLLETFDLPTVAPNCTQRNSSNVTPQSLLLMNGDFVIDQAKRLAARAWNEGEKDIARSLDRAWQLSYARSASPETIDRLTAFVREQTKLFQERDPKRMPAVAEQKALAVACQAILSANAFLYVD